MAEAEEIVDLEQSISEKKQQLLTLNEEITSIKIQIGEAKARRWSEDTFADPDWWRRANAALLFKGRECVALQAELGELKKQLRRKEQMANERLFITTAQSLLPPEQYRQIWDEVERRRLNHD